MNSNTETNASEYTFMKLEDDGSNRITFSSLQSLLQRADKFLERDVKHLHIDTATDDSDSVRGGGSSPDIISSRVDRQSPREDKNERAEGQPLPSGWILPPQQTRPPLAELWEPIIVPPIIPAVVIPPPPVIDAEAKRDDNVTTIESKRGHKRRKQTRFIDDEAEESGYDTSANSDGDTGYSYNDDEESSANIKADQELKHIRSIYKQVDGLTITVSRMHEMKLQTDRSFGGEQAEEKRYRRADEEWIAARGDALAGLLKMIEKGKELQKAIYAKAQYSGKFKKHLKAKKDYRHERNIHRKARAVKIAKQLVPT